MTKLKYVSTSTVDVLRESTRDNLSRYTSLGFGDVQGEWNLELSLEVDLGPLSDLDAGGGPEVEVQNSELVWRSLRNLSPALAFEEGIWVRLTHVECLAYARARWIKEAADDEKVVSAIDLHFFADTLTKRRDDNAISRLWWNGYIASRISPSDRLGVLRAILKTADIRSNIVERSQTASRTALSAGIVRLIQANPEATKSEERFRSFMKEVNRQGGGELFEAMSNTQVDQFVTRCWSRAE